MVVERAPSATVRLPLIVIVPSPKTQKPVTVNPAYVPAGMASALLKPGVPPEHVPTPGFAANADDPVIPSASKMPEQSRSSSFNISPPLPFVLT